MKITMNEISLMNYISHYLHTCICRYDGTCRLLSSCCARKDFSVSTLQPERLIKALITQSAASPPRIVSVQGNIVYSVVPFEEDFYLIGPNILQDTVHLNHRLSGLPETEQPHNSYDQEFREQKSIENGNIAASTVRVISKKMRVGETIIPPLARTAVVYSCVIVIRKGSPTGFQP